MANYVKTEPHPVRRVTDPGEGSGRHYRNGTRCYCHGHCGECGAPVVVDKLGRFRHVEEKAK